MQIVMEILVSIFLLIGTFFMLVGSIGMVRSTRYTLVALFIASLSIIEPSVI